MKYLLALYGMLVSFTLQAQDCGKLQRQVKGNTESIIIPAYIHTEGVCPDDTILLMLVRDEDKLYLTSMPSECRRPYCEYIIRKSRYHVTFADSSIYRYDEPYMTNYSSDELFIMLKGRIVTRKFHPKTYKATCKYSYADAGLLGKMLNTPVEGIQIYNAVPRSEWEEKPYKLTYEPGSFLQLSSGNAALLMQVLQCMVQ